LFDGLFHAGTYIFVLLGLMMLLRASRRPHFYWSGKLLGGSILAGFGLFNLLEGLIDHEILGLHHVNETVPPPQWRYWDIGFLAWGAVMLVGGLAMFRNGARRSPGSTSDVVSELDPIGNAGRRNLVTPVRDEGDPVAKSVNSNRPPVRTPGSGGVSNESFGRGDGKSRAAPPSPKTSGAPVPAPDISRSPLANRNTEAPRQAGMTPRPTDDAVE